MSFLGNLVWIVFGGFLSFLGYLIGGLALCITIVGIPFGIQNIKLGFATLMPFGREVVEKPGANGPLNVLFNVIWLVLFGWEIALNHLFWGVVLAITVIGIPFAKQHFKLVVLALLPFGRELTTPVESRRP